MGQNDEPKLDELKRLLRRLDGLDGNKTPAKATQEDGQQRGYVGALRGAPAPGEDGAAPLVPASSEKAPSKSAALIAATVAAVISTIAVYLLMSPQGPSERAGAAGQQERVVPSRLEYRQPAAGPGQRDSNDTASGLVRSADLLLEKGGVEAARALLQQAAELGSGPAALKLGRSYDPTQSKAPAFADSQTNPALAKSWYERAVALGSREAASYISDAGGR
jgi:TPR repeat protein